ncbi:hypothetical protein Q7C36_017713 [Tachysurus vachellii]|uniref:Transposase element L1Md-A101/L1Md-A102/L1Md-A2 n=1 Tax=Tachysurus vachellii TaxID=175792 RepID=A0AA88M430_TACVA|nr:hypothetical protein Q7C36_017713 [Tachysurus vachellii]
MDTSGLKSEILLALKSDISTVIKSELKDALAEDFDFLKSELRAVKSEIINSTAALRSELDQVKASVNDIEGGLSNWSDEVVALQSTVSELKSELTFMLRTTQGLKELKVKCEDLEGQMRRCNVRILGVPETPDSSSCIAVAKMLTEVLQLEKEPLIDRSHRTPGQKKPGGKPRVIVAKLHYYQDCVEILHRARTRGPLRFNDAYITILPDYTASVAKARAAFTDMRKLLRNRQGVRYGLLFPTRLRITHGEEDIEFADPNKAMAYVKENIILATDDGH